MTGTMPAVCVTDVFCHGTSCRSRHFLFIVDIYASKTDLGARGARGGWLVILSKEIGRIRAHGRGELAQR